MWGTISSPCMNLLFHPLHGVFHGEEAFSFEKAQLSQFFSLVIMTLVSDLGNCHPPVGSKHFFFFLFSLPWFPYYSVSHANSLPRFSYKLYPPPFSFRIAHQKFWKEVNGNLRCPKFKWPIVKVVTACYSSLRRCEGGRFKVQTRSLRPSVRGVKRSHRALWSAPLVGIRDPNFASCSELDSSKQRPAHILSTWILPLLRMETPRQWGGIYMPL